MTHNKCFTFKHSLFEHFTHGANEIWRSVNVPSRYQIYMWLYLPEQNG